MDIIKLMRVFNETVEKQVKSLDQAAKKLLDPYNRAVDKVVDKNLPYTSHNIYKKLDSGALLFSDRFFILGAVGYYSFVAQPDLTTLTITIASMCAYGLSKKYENRVLNQYNSRIENYNIRKSDGSPAVWSDIAKMKPQVSSSSTTPPTSP